jgi:hypothetical protein
MTCLMQNPNLHGVRLEVSTLLLTGFPLGDRARLVKCGSVFEHELAKFIYGSLCHHACWYDLVSGQVATGVERDRELELEASPDLVGHELVERRGRLEGQMICDCIGIS